MQVFELLKHAAQCLYESHVGGPRADPELLIAGKMYTIDFQRMAQVGKRSIIEREREHNVTHVYCLQIRKDDPSRWRLMLRLDREDPSIVVKGTSGVAGVR